MNLPASCQGKRTEDARVGFKERLLRKQEKNGNFLQDVRRASGPLFMPSFL